MRDGATAEAQAQADDRHLLTLARMTGDRRVDRSRAFLHRAPDESEIFAFQPSAAMIGEERGKTLMSRVALGDDEEAGGVLVEPVHNAGPLDTADAGEAVAAMGDEGVNQGALGVAGGGMDHQAGGLIKNQEMVVLEDDIERNVFAAQRRGFRRRR